MIATTKMSTRGQIVIPENIRDTLGLKVGAEFILIQQGENIVLKQVKSPSKEELKKILVLANKKAAELGITEEEIVKVIKEHRKQKRKA